MTTAKDACRTSLLDRPVSNTLLRALAFAALLIITVLLQLQSFYSVEVSTISGLEAYDEDQPNFEHMFATKTKYWDQRDGGFSGSDVAVMRAMMALPALASVDREPFPQELELIQTQIVARHGIRYPTGGNIRGIEALLERIQQFEDKLPTWMRNYSLPYNLSVQGDLAKAGKHELNHLGKRSLKQSGNTAPVTYSKEKYRVAHTHVARTRDSAIAFSKAFFENADEVEYIEYPEEKDFFLRFFDLCARYQREVKHNKTAQEQMYDFQQSSMMSKIAQKLKISLGLETESIEFSAKDLMTVQSACAFDIALYHRKHDWCSLMSGGFIRTLEYLDDLEQFYWIGGGYRINYEISALLLREVFDTMRARANGSNTLVGNFFLAHAETTLPLMTLLGYGDRSLLLANATKEEIASRGFHSSTLAPFAANVEFRLFERKARYGEYYVQILVNEKKGIIPGCGRTFCKLTELEQQWQYYLKTYDFHESCK